MNLSDTASAEAAATAIIAPEAPVKAHSFSEIVPDAAIVASLDALNIKLPTGVQVATIPAALAGEDLIVQAQTGSGKTLAFAIPLVLKIRNLPNLKETHGLIVSPTRELASQIAKVISQIAPEISPVCVIGGTSSREQIDDLGADRRVVVGTPGRLLDLIRRRELRLQRCEYFVLDEADEMLSMGFLEDVRSILSRLPDKRQGLFISATVTPRVRMLAESFLSKPRTIVIDRDTSTDGTIEHLYCEVETDLAAKAAAICDLIETQRPRSAIIFCNTKSDTELVEKFLRRRGFDACRINSDLSQNQREKIMQRARDGDLQILVATDVAARGIDIDHLDIVFSYSIHEQHEVYIHRTGRTGRAGRSGKAICVVSPYDFAMFHNLKKRINFEIKKMNLPSQEEVIDARLAHFYELVRESKVDLSDKERTIAKKMLADLADLKEPSEELVDMIGKLYSLTVQKVVQVKSEGEDTQGSRRASSANADDAGDDQGYRSHRGGEHSSSGGSYNNRDDRRSFRSGGGSRGGRAGGDSRGSGNRSSGNRGRR